MTPSNRLVSFKNDIIAGALEIVFTVDGKLFLVAEHRDRERNSSAQRTVLHLDRKQASHLAGRLQQAANDMAAAEARNGGTA